jgi:hypothetical protein
VRYRAEATDLGYRVVGEEFETTVYWDETGWQTTIPYWVELFGMVEEGVPAERPTSATPGMPGGV